MKAAVIGAGSWGTAIANMLGDKDFDVTLWAYEKEVAEGINSGHINPLYMKEYTLSKNVKSTTELKEALADTEHIVMVTPSHVFRGILEKMLPFIRKGSLIISATKGIENTTLMMMSEIALELIPTELQCKIAVFSGPTFAKEIIEKHPSAAVIASRDNEATASAVELLSTPYLRLYDNPDVRGVQLGGSIKNIIAIASGIGQGMELGLNSQAALITRGSAEMMRLAVKLGAQQKTLSGLAGIGDLVLTATGNLSRNRTLGVRLGKGETMEEILSSSITIAEGVKTTKSVYNLAKNLNVEVPIVDAVYSVLYENIPPREAVKKLMSRTLKNEFWWD